MMLHREARVLATGGALLVAAGLAANAQSPAAAPLAFEVASVKLNTSGKRGMGSRILPGGRYIADSVPIYWLISEAYRFPVQSSRLSGVPDWIRSDRYDIEAKADKTAIAATSTASAREAKMMAMLQTLLADRFQLKIHRETKETPVYALVVAKTGLKLRPAKVQDKDCLDMRPENGVLCHEFNGGQGRGLHATAVDMSDLVLWLENWTDRPLVDKTDLKGLFAIETEGWVPFVPRQVAPESNDEGLYDPSRPTLFMVLARLGLKLEAQKAPVDHWVVDHVERPSGN
jgi:uncharacterized protein (TIGR03435 family)